MFQAHLDGLSRADMASLKHTSPFFIEPGFKVLPITSGLEFEVEVEK